MDRLIIVFSMATWRSRRIKAGTHGFPSPDCSGFGFFTEAIFNELCLDVKLLMSKGSYQMTNNCSGKKEKRALLQS
jgi:hypothetical protein